MAPEPEHVVQPRIGDIRGLQALDDLAAFRPRKTASTSRWNASRLRNLAGPEEKRSSVFNEGFLQYTDAERELAFVLHAEEHGPAVARA